MSFLAPLWLALVLLGLLIVWLHLLRRTQRTQEVSSLFVWQRLAQNLPPQPPKQPPPLNPLLFLQLLFVVLLALALAQPVLGRLTTSGSHTIYILDASGSMAASDLQPSRFEAAKSTLLRELQTLRGNRVSLVMVGAVPYVVAARQQQISDITNLLAEVSGSDGIANWADTAGLVKALQVKDEPTRAVVFSDSLEAQTALAKVLPAKSLELRVLGDKLSNVGFFDIIPQASTVKKGLWRLEGHIANYTPEDRKLELQVLFHNPDGSAVALSKNIYTVPVSTAGYFHVEAIPPGPGVVELRLPPDGLEADNHLYLNLPAGMPKSRVLYLGSGNPALQKALLSMPDTEVFSSDKLPPDSNTYSLVVVDGIKLERHPQTHTLWINTNPTPGAGNLPELADPYPSGWQSNHPLSGSLDWSEVLLNKALDVPKLPGAEILLEAGGKPLVQARTTPYGREVTLSFSLDSSNWTVKSSFPVFVANLLRWAELRLNSTPFCRAGEPCPLEPKLLAGDWKLLDPQGRPVSLPIAFSQTGSEKDPNLSRWLLRALEGAFRPQKAGIYTLVSDGVRHLIPVSAFFASESDLRQPLEPISNSDSLVSKGSKSLWPLWNWLLLLGVLALLLEGFLGGRAEGFLKWQNLIRRNPLASRRRNMLILQSLAAFLLLLGLLGFRLPQPTRTSQSTVVADRSELYVGSSKERLESSLQSLTRASSSPRGVVWLGDPPTIGSDLSNSAAFTSPAPDEAPGTDLQTSLSLAGAMLPPGPSNRITLIADGSETRGSFTDALGQLLGRKIPVDVVPVGGIPKGEVFIEQITLPKTLNVGSTFVLQGIVYSDQTTVARLRVWRTNKIWKEQEIQLLPGRNRVEVPLHEDKEGDFSYRLEVFSPGDTFAQNNSASVLASVRGSSKIALFSSEPEQAQIMSKALRLQGLDVEVLLPESMPETFDKWSGFQAAILMNVPAIRLKSEQQKALESWVKDGGGGLLILGGPKSFGPGGYYQTALDRLSPLSSKVPREAPKVAMLFVLDKSGSMNQPAGNVRRIDIATEATTNALNLLHPQSLAGVIGFDVKAQLVVPMQSVQDKVGFKAKISKLAPGGGTSLYPALELALTTLQNVDAPGRHIVLMTDGLSIPGDFQGIVNQIVADKITLSTVAVGEGARLDLMENIARWGGGVAHVATEWQSLPSILAQEALLQSKTPVKQQVFTPVWRDRSPSWLSGLPETMPPLRAYVQTTAKPEALVHLLGPSSDPLLASWRYGLGQVVAFTSQSSGSWSADWLQSAQYPRIWGQIMHALLPNTAQAGLNPILTRKANNAHLQIEAVLPTGNLQSGLNLEAIMHAPDGSQRQIPLLETVSGLYETRFSTGQIGNYSLEVRAALPRLRMQRRPFNLSSLEPPTPAGIRLAFSVPYPPRFAFDSGSGDALTAIAIATGGKVLLGDAPSPPTGQLHWRWLPAWPLLTLLSLLMFIWGLVLRYAPNLRLARRQNQAEAVAS